MTHVHPRFLLNNASALNIFQVNTKSSQFLTAFKRLKETLTEENLNAQKKIGEMKLSEDEIVVGIGVHLIKVLQEELRPH